MAIEKKLIHFGKLADFETQLTAENILDYSIVFIQDAKKIWTHGTYYDCSERSGTNNPKFLLIGDVSDEAKANFIAVANGDISADYYIVGSKIQGVDTFGLVASLVYAGPSGSPSLVSYTFYGATGSGQLSGDLLKINTTLTVSSSSIETTFEVVLDAKQDTLVSGTNIKTINGESVLGEGDITTPISDWSATSFDSGYIKNRTHYYTRQGAMTSFSVSSSQINTNIFEVYTDVDFVVNNTVYRTLSDLNKEIPVNTGAGGVATVIQDGSQYYLQFTSIAGGGITFDACNRVVVQPLSETFIPDTIARVDDFKTINGQSIVGSGDIIISGGNNVQSNWSENDPTSDSYVQGRTHYSYDVEQIALFSIASKNEGDILVTGLYDGGFYTLYNQAGGKSEYFHFVEGRKISIPSIGPRIEAVCTYEDDYCLKLTTPTYGMNESFSLREMYVEQLKDIYIPETIARKDDVTTITTDDIDLIWNSYFSEDGYGSASATALDDVINSIGVGDYDETEE